MDFARQQRDPTRHLVGITAVILLHIFVIWALMSGLARKAVEVIKKPLSATVVQEIKAPPPPPPPPKKIEVQKTTQPVPQQTYVPPPDVTPQVQPQGPTITAETREAPKEAYVIQAPPPVVEAPPAPPKPAVRRGIVPVEREDPVYPRAAIRAGIDKGRVLARVNIDEKGNVTDVHIVSADPPRHFDSAVRDALMKWKFKAEGEKYVGEVEVIFTLKD
jgi:protein TonB